MSKSDFTFQIWQGGVQVVVVTAPNLDDAIRETNHYLMMYAQDGAVEVRGKHIPKWFGRLKQHHGGTITSHETN